MNLILPTSYFVQLLVFLRAIKNMVKKLLHKITDWERWPFKLLYAPLTPVWGWYMLRSWSIWFFTPSNPKLTFGGMEGEPKKEMYDLLPEALYPKTIYVVPGEEHTSILEKMENRGLRLPAILKPEAGGQGILLRKVDKIEELLDYHSKVPVEYIVQELVEYPMEVSVFYFRYPDKLTGKVTGFLHKLPLQVNGDGVHTLHQLIQQHPKAYKREEELQGKHGINFNNILKPGEKYMLSYAANHNRGARFINLASEIDEKLVKVFDELSLLVNDFYYGRYDIMCASVEDLKNGKNFSILEYNGCGAEPNHFYDTGYTLLGAYREILKHWKVLYRISRYNNSKGIKYWPLFKGIRFRKATNKHYAIMREADKRI